MLLEMLRKSKGVPREAPLPFDLEAAVHGDFSVTLAAALQLRYDAARGVLTLEFTGGSLGAGRTKRTAKLPGCRKLRMLADLSSAEIYLDDGACVFSTRYYPDCDRVPLRVCGAAGTIWHMKGLEVT